MTTPTRQEFRADQRLDFLAAVNAAAHDPAMLLTIETDADGNTVAIIHRALEESAAAASDSIPQVLDEYLVDWQRAAYTIEALLAGAIALAQEASQDDIEWSLQHIHGLVNRLADGLDRQNVRRALQAVQA